MSDVKTNLVVEFLAELDRLRQDRRLRGSNAELDRPFLNRLDELYDRLDEDEYELVNGEGWRGWPDQYDARMVAFTGFRVVEVLVDPYVAETTGLPPRAEAA